LWRYAVRGRFARLFTRSFFTLWLKLRAEQQECGIRRKESVVATGRAAEDRAHRFLDALLRWTLLRHSPRRDRLVKSVHACFCAEWVVRQTAVDDVLIVLRSPYAVIASLKRMGMPDGWREGSMRPYLSGEQCRELSSSATSVQSALRRIAVQVCRQHQALLSARERNPQWHVTTHEHLCEDARGNFRTLFDQLGLDWGASIERHIASRDRPGHGYQTLRMAKQQADKWKEELTAEEVAMIDRELQAQGLAEWTGRELAAR
jgi:hypothetical protein